MTMNERTRSVFSTMQTRTSVAPKTPQCQPIAAFGFNAPIHYLLFHAAELYLKSVIFGREVEDLETVKELVIFTLRFGKAAAFGMNLPAKIREIFEVEDRTDAVIENRYLRTGPKQRIDTMALLTASRGARQGEVESRVGRSRTGRLPKLC